MAFIYADGIDKERGGGLLQYIDLPVPRCSTALSGSGGGALGSPQGGVGPSVMTPSIPASPKHGPASSPRQTAPSDRPVPLRRSSTLANDAMRLSLPAAITEPPHHREEIIVPISRSVSARDSPPTPSREGRGIL